MNDSFKKIISAKLLNPQNYLTKMCVFFNPFNTNTIESTNILVYTLHS